jgi:glutamate-1-semialdehyde 2,1-aminomutase
MSTDTYTPSAVSNELANRAKTVLPGGVNSNVRLAVKESFLNRGAGSRVWDVNGNEYIDYLLGQGPNFLGHANPQVLEAVSRVMQDGMLFGAQNPLEVEAAELVIEAVKWGEQLRFCVTGTEAVQTALRVARAHSGKNKIIRFQGHYHGWLDNVLTNTELGEAKPLSQGQGRYSLNDCYVLPWNDLAAVKELVAIDPDIAAIITEPMMVNSGAIVPDEGYLAGLREICTDNGIVLIFDEVITGFRLSRGGGAERFGVTPDLATYGKAIAGGFPVAAIVGSGELLEKIGTGQINHSGTFNGYAIGCAATIASMKILAQPNAYQKLEAIGSKLISGMKDLAQKHSAPLHIQGVPMAFHLSFGSDDSIHNFADLQKQNDPLYKRFVTAVREQNIWITDRGIWYVSMAHSEADVAETLVRFDKALSNTDFDQ